MAFNKTITLTMEDGSVFQCSEDAPDCGSVVVAGAKCPVCRNKYGIVDWRGRVVGVTGIENRDRAVKELTKEHGKVTVAEPPVEFRVRCNQSPSEDYDTFTGPADCNRCVSRVGTLTVKVATMWGIEEDRRVLHGRYRVY